MLSPESPPLVSVVVPAYNAAATLGRSIASVLDQGRADVEVIVVDDGSSDGTAELAAALATEHPGVTALRQANAGPSAARNRGLAQATGRWVLFLDADDTLAAGSLDALLAGAALDPHTRWLHGGWTRTLGNAPPTRYPAKRLYEPAAELARHCPFAIHACLVDRAAVVAAGGFDPDLRTCEDWDLWAKLARGGVDPVPVEATVADYVVREASASMDWRRMLEDGLRVIDRGHDQLPALAAERGGVRAAYVSYVAGLVIGQGGDAGKVLAAAGELAAPDVDPASVAGMLVIAVPLGRLLPMSAWPVHDAAVLKGLNDYLGRLEALTSATALGARVLRRLEHQVAAVLGPLEAPLRFGQALIVDVDFAAAPWPDLALSGDVQRVHLRGALAGELMASAEVAPLGGKLLGRDCLDALLDTAAWAVTEALVLEPLLDQLTITPSTDAAGTIIARGPVVLATAAQAPVTTRERLDLVGWTLLMQELIGDPSATPDSLYDAGAAIPSGDTRTVNGRTRVELSGPLPELRSAEPSVFVDATLGGEPLDGFWIALEDGRVSAARLRSQLLLRSGVQLARVALRAWLSRPDHEALTLGEALRAAAAEPSMPQPVGVVAQRAELPPLPARHQARTVGGDAVTTLRDEAAALGRSFTAGTDAGQLVVSAAAGPLAAEAQPPIAPPDAQAPGTSRPRRSAASFEALFASEADPWRYASGYEQTKYEQTLRLLPSGTKTVLELACAEGHFTAQVAELVDRVVASDVSNLALERAAERCAGLSNIEFSRVDLFRESIVGQWESVVCSEVLYYAGGQPELAVVAGKLAGAVQPGGVLLTAHANLVVDDPTQPGFDWNEQFGSLGIQRALLATGHLTLEEEIVTPMYRVQRYRRPSRRWLRRRTATITTAGAVSPDLSDDVRAHFLPDGGAPQSSTEAERTGAVPLEVPILMYHRVAPDGPNAMRRYRVTPEEFTSQLAFFAKAGYASITPGQWRDAVTLGRPLPEQPIMFTFDDGYQDFAEHAAPALAQHGFTATVLVVGERVGDFNRWDGARDPQPLMDWPTIRALQREGVSFGGHTLTHPPLTGLGPAQIVEEIGGSMAAVATALGEHPSSFAYPYGDVSGAVRSLAGLAGVELGFTCESRVARQSDDLLMLPRIEVRGDQTLSALLRQLSAW